MVLPVFHRLTNPGADYFVGGGGTLPSLYDYINNDPTVTAGTAPSTPAQVTAGPKSAGFNQGSYFVAWRDSATSLNVNRPAMALAQNTDYLDGLLRRRMAVPKKVAVTINGTDAYVQLTDWVWCGTNPSAAATTIAVFLYADGTDAEAQFHTGLNLAYGPTAVKDSGGAASVIGGGWVLNPRLYINSPAGGSPFSGFVVYGVMDSLGTQPTGSEFDLHKWVSVPFSLQQLLFSMKGPASASHSWNFSPVSNLEVLKAKGLNESYRGSDSSVTGTPGIGATIQRDGKSVEVQSQIADRSYLDSMNACFAATMIGDNAVATGNSRTTWAVGSVGMSVMGKRWKVQGEKDTAPSVASYFSGSTHTSSLRSGSVGGHYYYTNIPSSTAATIAQSGTDGAFELTITAVGDYPAPYFWRDMGAGVHKTAMVAGKDIIKIYNPTAGWTRSFVVVALYNGQSGLASNNKKCLVYPLDTGVQTDIIGTESVNITWISTQFAMGYGGGRSKTKFDGITPPGTIPTSLFSEFGFEDFYLAAEPPLTNNSTTSDAFYNPPSTQSMMTVMSETGPRKLWRGGYYNGDPSVAGIVDTSFIYGSGDAFFLGTVTVGQFFSLSSGQLTGTLSAANLSVNSQAVSGATTTIDTSLGQYVAITNPTAGSTTLAYTLTNLVSGVATAATVVLSITRTTNALTKLNLFSTGVTVQWSGSDQELSPVTSGSVTDVYVGYLINTTMYMSCLRY